MRTLVILILVSLSAVMLFATGVSASDASWLIAIKATSPAVTHGGVAAFVGVGTSTNLSTQWSVNSGMAQQAESTSNYGDTNSWHQRHDVPRATDGGERYYWDLKIGAMLDYQYSTINISLWNNRLPGLLGLGGELNHDLAYVFAKRVSETDQVMAWFTDSSLMGDFLGVRPGMDSGLWHDTSILIRNATNWSVSTSDQGFYVTDTVTNGTEFGALGDYRLYAFDLQSAQNWTDPLPMPSEDPVPEPGSLLALGSGLLGAAGVALRKRKA